MEAELLLDGLFTHANFHPGCMREIHRKRVGKALSAVKSARDMLRHDAKTKQWTLTTRGSINSPFNRHHRWEFNAKPEWKCDCNLPFFKKQKKEYVAKMPNKKQELVNKLKNDPSQTKIT